MTTLRVRPEADRDIDRAADYYAGEAGVDLALRFLGAIEEAATRLCEYPHMGAAPVGFHPRLTGMRFLQLPGFESHLLFYIPEPGCIDVVRALHGAQDLRRILEDYGAPESR